MVVWHTTDSMLQKVGLEVDMVVLRLGLSCQQLERLQSLSKQMGPAMYHQDQRGLRTQAHVQEG